jgi:hypothetical protein
MIGTSINTRLIAGMRRTVPTAFFTERITVMPLFAMSPTFTKNSPFELFGLSAEQFVKPHKGVRNKA